MFSDEKTILKCFWCYWNSISEKLVYRKLDVI